MKLPDFFSERMLFGAAIIGGYFGTAWGAMNLIDDPEGRQVARDVLVGTGPIVGMIAQSIWKTDKVDRQAADTAAVLASKAPDLSGTGAGVTVQPVVVTNDPANPVPTTDAPGDDPFRIKP